MLSSAEALRRSLNRAAQQGEDLCLSLGHAARSQKLPPAALIRFLIAAEGGSLAKELHRAKIDATPAAITQRRAQIPPEVFREVFTRFNASSVYNDLVTIFLETSVQGQPIVSGRLHSKDELTLEVGQFPKPLHHAVVSGAGIGNAKPFAHHLPR